jgi:nicotinate-nucleotide adenylyltransferase
VTTTPSTVPAVAGGQPIIGVFGGSFNPPHLSHVLALAVVLARFEVERLLVIPAYQHPFAKALAPYEDRVTMCELAMGWLPRVEVSRVEEELGGQSRTLWTIEHLMTKYPGKPLRFIMGADIMVESSKWYGFDRIVELAPPIVLGRVGIDYPGAPLPVLPAISSTEVRAKLAEGDLGSLAELVPREVITYATARRLYAKSGEPKSEQKVDEPR